MCTTQLDHRHRRPTRRRCSGPSPVAFWRPDPCFGLLARVPGRDQRILCRKLRMELPLSIFEASVPRETVGTMPLEPGACQRSHRLPGWHAGATRLSVGGKLLRSTTMHLPVLSYLVVDVAPRTPALCVLNGVPLCGPREGQARTLLADFGVSVAPRALDSAPPSTTRPRPSAPPPSGRGDRRAVRRRRRAGRPDAGPPRVPRWRVRLNLRRAILDQGSRGAAEPVPAPEPPTRGPGRRAPLSIRPAEGRHVRP